MEGSVGFGQITERCQILQKEVICMLRYTRNQYVIVDLGCGKGEELAIVARADPVMEVMVLSGHKPRSGNDFISCTRPIRHATLNEVVAASKAWEAENDDVLIGGQPAVIDGIVYATDSPTVDFPASPGELAVFVLSGGKIHRVPPESSFLADLIHAVEIGNDPVETLVALADRGRQSINHDLGNTLPRES